VVEHLPTKWEYHQYHQKQQQQNTRNCGKKGYAQEGVRKREGGTLAADQFTKHSLGRHFLGPW
jgi:hypothetical protein